MLFINTKHSKIHHIYTKQPPRPYLFPFFNYCPINTRDGGTSQNPQMPTTSFKMVWEVALLFFHNVTLLINISKAKKCVLFGFQKIFICVMVGHQTILQWWDIPKISNQD